MKDVPKIRILLDEMEFADENDELMRYIMQLKRQGRIELIVISQNVKESMKGNADLDFANVCSVSAWNTGCNGRDFEGSVWNISIS